MRSIRRTAIIVTGLLSAGLLIAATPATNLLDSVVGSLMGAEEAPTAAVPKWQKRLVDAAKPTPAGVRIRVVVTDDPISATTRSEFLQSLSSKQRALVMEREGGRGPMGLRWLLRWNWETEVHLGGCQFKSATVTVEYNADFATLGGPIAADSVEQAWWNAELEQLFTSRVETLKILRDGAREIQQKVSLMRSSSCGDLTSRATDVARTHLLEVNARAGGSFANVRQMPDEEAEGR